ncbi:MAG: ActD-like protein [Proteobacteria bacterium]|nr:ActD-like protein [Pseudomonadota bacterium]
MNVEQRVTNIELEQLALGELEPEREKQVRQRLAEEPGGTARLADLQTSNEEILRHYPPGLMAARIDERVSRLRNKRSERSRVRLALPAITAAAAATALAWIFLPAVPLDTEPSSIIETPEVIISKGSSEPTLFIFRKGLQDEELLKKGASISAGDVLQLKYAARGASHGVIFSIDGLGAVTLHFPGTPEKSTVLKKDGARALAFSYELDNAPGFERFFFVTSQKSIDVNEVLAAGRRLGARETGGLDLPANLYQSDFLLKKK